MRLYMNMHLKSDTSPPTERDGRDRGRYFVVLEVLYSPSHKLKVNCQ